MVQILGDDAARIEEGRLRLRKRNAMLQAVGPILDVIPFEARFAGRRYGIYAIL
jgi:hypothetical protein